MSTIKSSAEDLTLNADGSGNDIKFQSNGSEVGSLTAEGVLTATSFAGSGAALTGLSSFDPDGAVTINDTGADVDFRVESDGNANMLFVDGGEDAVLIGHNASDGKGASLQIHGTGGHALEMSRWADSANGVNLTLTKSRGASVGTEGIVSDGDTAGQIAWNVDDGTDQASQIAAIKAAVDGTPGANDTPGRLVFSTTADGSDSTTERMRIDSSGNVGVGVTPENWHANWTPLQLGATGFVGQYQSGATDLTGLGSNIYSDGTYRYIETDEAAMLKLQNGIFLFEVAPSGSADAEINWTTAMKIANDGIITKPTQPCFSVTCPGQTNLSQGAYRSLTLTNEIYDIGSNFNTGTSTFTAPVTGKYFISVHFKMEQIQNGASYIRFLLTTSNRGYSAQLDPRVFDTDGDYWSVYITHLCDMDVNDTAYARLKQMGGSSHMDLSTESMMTGILLA